MVEPRLVTEAMYANDTASQSLGIEITETLAGAATATMTVTPTMTNGHDVCHGGLIFALADTAMAFASNSYNEMALAAMADIDFLNPARAGSLLTASATETSSRGRGAIYDVTVTDDAGTTIAVFRGRTRRVGGAIVEDTP
jgi:acyl-CoA thioesterase